jgi:hypothetical protein
MYVRVTTIELNPERIYAAIRQFQDQTLPQVRKLQGFEGASLLVNREGGKAMAFTYWTDREALDSSTETANRVRNQFVEDAHGARVASVEVYEVALEEGRARPPETG